MSALERIVEITALPLTSCKMRSQQAGGETGQRHRNEKKGTGPELPGAHCHQCFLQGLPGWKEVGRGKQEQSGRS